MRKSTSSCERSASPPTKRYPGQLPLFPIIYRLQVRFNLEGSPLAELPAIPTGDKGFRLDAPDHLGFGPALRRSQYQVLEYPLNSYAAIYVRYQLHAYNKRQRLEQAHHQRLRQLSALAVRRHRSQPDVDGHRAAARARTGTPAAFG